MRRFEQRFPKEESMPNKFYFDAFDPEKKSETTCLTCGLCLQKCPVMGMDKKEAISEMAHLLKGEETERVFKECTLCFRCNHYCPHNLRPYALIMGRIAERNKKSGKQIPPPIKYFFNDGESCIMLDVYETLSSYEKEILDRWEKIPPRSEEVLFIGCAGREIPYGIENSSALKDLPKFGPRKACCGELPFRFGDYEAFSKRVDDTLMLFEGLDIKRLVCYCGSCANFFGNIWPNYHGVKLPFEVTNIWEWLWERVQTGKLNILNKMSGRVAVTDSCYSSELGDRFFDAVRGLNKAIGLEVIELKNNRYDGLSCGMISAGRNCDMADIMVEAKKKVDQIVETGATDVTCHCPGCYDVLDGATKGSGIRCHYGLEEILWALGDEMAIPFKHRVMVQRRILQKRFAPPTQ
jgi:Fe-S oxidoreductase